MRRRLEDKEEEICELRHAAEVFDAEKMKAVNDAKVVVRWELMRESDRPLGSYNFLWAI